MAGRVFKYFLAASLTAAVAGAVFGPFGCGLYGCVGGFSKQTFVWALIVGAIAGIAGMALADFLFNGRYALANRAEAKRQRRRAEGSHHRSAPETER